MRDYKNVKVPRKYRTQSTRIVKRVDASRNARKTGKGSSGIKAALLNIFGFAVVAACCWSGWQGYGWLTHAPIFQIAGVDVNGVRYLAERDLKNIVGEFTGQNIFRADLQSAIRRARANPWIKDATIHRSLPNRIAMSVVERVPHVILDTEAGRYLMDNEAVVIDRAAKDSASAWPLPVIVFRDCRARLGDPVTAEGITEALTLLSEIEARGGWKVADVTIKAPSPEGLSAVYADHEFKIGSGNYAEKLRRLSEVMQDVKQRGLNIAYVDIRPERQAAVMLTKGAEAGGAVRNRKKNSK